MARSRALSAAIAVVLLAQVRDCCAQGLFQGALPQLVSTTVESLSAPNLLQSILLGKQSVTLNPFLSSVVNRTANTNIFEQLLGGSNPLASPFIPKGAQPPSNILQQIVQPGGASSGDRASAGPAGGVVANALFLAAGISLTVTGSLGTAYAGLTDELGLIGGLGARVNLGFEYTKAALGAAEQAAKSREELTKTFLTWAGDAPAGLERVTEVRNALSGTILSQLPVLQSQISNAAKALKLARSVASGFQ